MHRPMRATTRFAILALMLLCSAIASAADAAADARLRAVVDAAIGPIMSEHQVPGIAVAVVAGGRRQTFEYGVTAPGGDRAVAPETLFEIGSISKPYAATLAAYAEATGRLSFSDRASRHMPALAGRPVGDATLEALGTYSAGGLPLQFPDTVTDDASMLAWLRGWTPAYPPGTRRLYSNPSIGLFGHLAAFSLGADFATLMDGTVLPALGLSSTFIDVPAERMADFAWGTARDGSRRRMARGAHGAEAYGIHTTAADLLRFVELHIDPSGLDQAWRRALATTRRPRYQAEGMLQGLGWESYAYPVALDTLLAGNDIALTPTEVRPLTSLPAEVLVNKTGSTGGFGAYVAFVPTRGIGVVILANRDYPIPARIRAAYAILAELDPPTTQGR